MLRLTDNCNHRQLWLEALIVASYSKFGLFRYYLKNEVEWPPVSQRTEST